jgi:hypothetical protein
MSASSREIVSDAVLAEFNAWMEGTAKYSELSPAGRAYCDAYLEEYWWQYMDDLFEESDA